MGDELVQRGNKAETQEGEEEKRATAENIVENSALKNKPNTSALSTILKCNFCFKLQFQQRQESRN